jgi:hypothetical protein
MKKIGDDYWTYRGCDVFLMGEHPKLYGKYEIFRGDDFIARAETLKQAKIIIKLLL